MSVDRPWGIELIGSAESKAVWQRHLREPYDPHLIEVDHEFGPYLALISTRFITLKDTAAVYSAATDLISVLNAIMVQDTGVDPIRAGAVVEFVTVGAPRKHHFVVVEAATYRIRVDPLTSTVGEEDAASPRELKPSIIQKKLNAIEAEPRIETALRYLEGEPSWVELYKAYEVLKNVPQSGLSNKEIDRFRQTANAVGRHHPSPKCSPPCPPMQIGEARQLFHRWIAYAIDELRGRTQR